MTIEQLMRWQSRQVKVSARLAPMLGNVFIWPNQVAYVVDIYTNEITESIGSFNTIFGYANREMKRIEQLYEPIVRNHSSAVVQVTKSAIQWGLSLDNFENTFVQYGYKIQNRKGRVLRILRQGKLLRDCNGNITHSMCSITDISGIDSRDNLTLDAFGPGAHLLDTEIPEICLFQDKISPREIEILKLVARGLSSSQIAARLYISKNTVDTHRRNMIRKLEVNNSMQLVNLARDLKLF